MLMEEEREGEAMAWRRRGEGRLVVRELPGRGRSFVLAQDVAPGSVLLFSPAHACVVDSASRGRVCLCCTRTARGGEGGDGEGTTTTTPSSPPARLPVPCPGACGQARYCSEGCRDEDWSSWHQYECPFLHAHPRPQRAGGLVGEEEEEAAQYRDDYLWLLMRVLIRHVKHLASHLATTPASAPAPSSTPAPLAEIWTLCDNASSVAPDKLAEFQGAAAHLALFLRHHLLRPPCFPGVTEAAVVADFAPDLERLLLLLVCKEESNSFGLYSFLLRGPGVPRQSFGLALFTEAVFFNHSCAPTVGHCTRITEAGVLGNLFYSIAGGKAGEEATISYIPCKAEWSEAERRQRLWDTFHFDCQCALCLGTVTQPPAQLICAEDACFGWYVPEALGRPNCLLAGPRSPRTSPAPGVQGQGLVAPAGARWLCEGCGSKRPNLPAACRPPVDRAQGM
jgi:hypothetical protein